MRETARVPRLRLQHYIFIQYRLTHILYSTIITLVLISFTVNISIIKDVVYTI